MKINGLSTTAFKNLSVIEHPVLKTVIAWHYIFSMSFKYIRLNQSNTFINVIGLLAGVFTALSMLPQVIKTLKEKKAEDVSPLMLITLISGLTLWVFYGTLKNDLPIFFTNGFSLLLNFFMLFLRWKYRER